MTRFLSESLQAPEPSFRLGLRDLERANGAPNADIILSTEVLQATRDKYFQLGLDLNDSTGLELYLALQERMKRDDKRLVKSLRTRAATHISADGNVVAGMAHALRGSLVEKSCFALKSPKLKALIKKVPPKKVMKQLGYRSVDSLLKHEAGALILGAAQLLESAAWQRGLLDQYKHLSASDFENRDVAILHPAGKRWENLAHSSVVHRKHNLLVFEELGTLILLPLPENSPAGSVSASLLLSLQALNDIRASSTFLKLCQMRADFGGLVQKIATSEPTLQAKLLDQPVPWHLIQRSFSRLENLFHQDLLAPHMSIEDLSWHSVEQALIRIEPSLVFWKHSAHLGTIYERRPVSFNIIDAALNLCNDLPFEHRIVHYFQQSLWHELLLRYLQPQALEQAVFHELQPELASELATG